MSTFKIDKVYDNTGSFVISASDSARVGPFLIDPSKIYIYNISLSLPIGACSYSLGLTNVCVPTPFSQSASAALIATMYNRSCFSNDAVAPRTVYLNFGSPTIASLTAYSAQPKLLPLQLYLYLLTSITSVRSIPYVMNVMEASIC